MRRFEIDAERAGDRVDKLLARLLPETSRATIQRWILEQRVLIDGRVCRAREVLALGSVIELSPGPPPVTEVVADASVPFGVVFEDSHLVVVDKPAGIVVHPARGNWQGTLVSGLLAREGFGGSVAGLPHVILAVGLLRVGLSIKGGVPYESLIDITFVRCVVR